MWAATAWDDSDWDGNRARGWTVVRRLRAKQATCRHDKAKARRSQETSGSLLKLMTPGAWEAEQRARRAAKWTGGPTVVALLFAHPGSPAIRVLDERGGYFDVRTGNTWDLFFPGYYRTPEDERFEHHTGARRVGHDFAAQWFFNPRDFDQFRREVETKSGKRWTYSGGTDLVLINAWIPEAGEPTIDWVSTIAGQLDDDSAGATDVSLANVVERITRDLEDDREDPAYGVGDVTDGPSQPPRSTAARDLMINALGGIAAALGVKALGG